MFKFSYFQLGVTINLFLQPQLARSIMNVFPFGITIQHQRFRMSVLQLHQKLSLLAWYYSVSKHGYLFGLGL